MQVTSAVPKQRELQVIVEVRFGKVPEENSKQLSLCILGILSTRIGYFGQFKVILVLSRLVDMGSCI